MQMARMLNKTILLEKIIKVAQNVGKVSVFLNCMLFCISLKNIILSLWSKWHVSMNYFIVNCL